ncbi:MAG: DEAD/DEAH box helicase family protein [Cytophagales bacterium]|nr:DEAD/DEAH box helicase family protein [Cytophagales bacterium]
MSKSGLSEIDICDKYITPAVLAAGWDLRTQIAREVSFTDGRIIVRGKTHTRGKQKRADYILYYKPNIPIAIIEAKDNKHSVGAGMQQGLGYADILQIPFVFSSNGDAFIYHDKTGLEGFTEEEITLEEFPTPSSLWNKYLRHVGISDPEVEKLLEQDYYQDDSGKSPRYYQQNAINRTIENIAKGNYRNLLVMATGTGKTYTAFQIIWRLWKAKRVSRVLFLADRNALVDQTKNNDFKPLGSEIMTKIQRSKIDKSYQIYFALYQSLTGEEEVKNVFKKFSPDFFDLIIIDECHRGSAREASAWHEILTYFSNAIHIGLTATPKETKDISNISYFGDPVYTYTLRQGIDDGFLAPYKVIRVSMDVDEGYRPEKGKVDNRGNVIEDRIYNLKDFNRNIVIDDRTKKVAAKITEFLRSTDRFAKTIVFCVDIEHAEAMRRALVELNSDLYADYSNYVVRITGDSEEGKVELDPFMDVEERFPVIATTSKMLTTGVDTKMVKVIALDTNIGSMTEFKQIIGRGTRIREDEGKVYFNIMDFRKVTNMFADPDFDGDPVQIYEPSEEDSPVPPEFDEEYDIQEPDARETVINRGKGLDPTGGETRPKYYVMDVPVSVVNERVQYYGADGKLITESLKDYTRKNVQEAYGSLDGFLDKWTQEEKKTIIMNEMAEIGVLWEALSEEVGQDLDPFDLICHVAYDQPPLTRKQRASIVRGSNYFSKYSEQAQAVLQKLLDKYEVEGITTIESGEVIKVYPLTELGTPVEIVRAFGRKIDFELALRELENEIYKTA